jgi:hypothetical protein
MNHHACERSCHHKRGLGALVRSVQSDHRSFVRRARRFHRRALKGAIMNTTHSSSLAVEVPAYAQLQREMHDALLAQHPDWILPDGDCPTLRLSRREICEAAHPNVANGASQTEARQHSISIRIPISFPRHYDA